MDVSNEHLKALLEKTDLAFQALLREPDSEELNLAYEEAKAELDSYISSVRQRLSQRNR
ncbi:hypothetical protein [Aestuariibacter sp. A3R04]|uniref:hypothetical protein n=1 Tax=Aestuariibacter sp. A3R04 TaxID=2841571 RepID=UPI001C091F77|nr:hypothetical protein [Aestuariibacter sp. A3R04]MBU3021427.1 hypothetical protein [Aestuariibacter sp. A3R04]